MSDEQITRGGAAAELIGAPLSSADVTEVVRGVIGQLAPEELAVFDAVADAWASEPMPHRRSGRAPGAAVGFGVEAVLLSQLAFPIVTGALGDVLGTTLTERARRKRKLSRSAADAAPQAPEQQPTAPAAPAVSPEMSSEHADPGQLSRQLARDLRESCEQHARALGLPPAKAELLADAFLGSLSSALGW